jgi:hypothetical protein
MFLNVLIIQKYIVFVPEEKEKIPGPKERNDKIEKDELVKPPALSFRA